MPVERVRAAHIAYLFVGLLAGWLICAYGPAAGEFVPQTAALRSRLHAATLEAARADSSRVAYALRVRVAEGEVARLRGEQAAYRATVHGLAVSNSRLVDSLRALARTAADSAAVTRLGSGIEEQDRACDMAMSACEAAQAVLRRRIVQDSARADSADGRAARNLQLSSDAVAAAERSERAVQRVRGQRNLLLVVAGVLTAIQVLR